MFQSLVRKLQKLNWSIHYKLGLAFALVLVCFILNGVISVLLLNNIKQTEERQRTIAISLAEVQRLDLAYRNQLGLYGDAIFLIKSIYFNNTTRDSIFAIQNDIEKDGSAVKEYNREFTTSFARLYLPVLNHLQDLDPLIRHGEFDQGRLKWQSYTSDFDQVTNLLTARHDQLETARSQGETELNNSIFLSIVLIAGFTFLSIALALSLLFLIGRVLVQPINQLQAGLEKVSEGDLEQELEIHNRDEVGKLAASFKSAIASLQQVLRGVHISESLQKVTGQLASVSKQQASGSSEQVTALSQVTAAMQELGQTAEQIADSAVRVSNLTVSTLEQIGRVALAGNASQERAHEMVEVVESTLNGVERVGKQVSGFHHQMGDLNEQTAEISKVVGLLGSIADEVHLLALNAAIEAAGAGEYGERFRAVAHQIKQLAARSNQATQEARNLISNVQASSRTVLAEVEEGQAEVEAVLQASSGLRSNLKELEQSAQEVGESVEHLMTLAGQVNDQAEEIRQATQQQRASSEMVVVSTRSAEEVAEQTASATKQIAKSSSQLETLTNQLNRVLNQVRLAV